MQKVASSPQALGRTMLPKVPLSYRWVISDAEVFLKNCDQHDGLQSPKFSTTLPLYNKTTTQWELVMKRSTSKAVNCSYSLFLCNDQKQRIDYAAQSTTGRVSGITQRDPSGLFTQRDHGIFKAPNHQLKNESKLQISNCVFSILSSSTSTPRLTATLPNTTYEVGQPLVNFGKQDFITNLSGYLEDGMLTIQVDAMLLCFTDPVERLENSYVVPEDGIRETIKSIYTSGAFFSDLTIKCAKKTFKAHKVILAFQSPVFKKMFEINMKEKKSNTVEITDLEPKVVSELLDYLYTGDCPNLSSLAKELVNVANKYQLPRLMAMCEKELESKVTAESVIELLLLADLHQAVHLRTVCMKFIKVNPTDIFQSEGWKSLKVTPNCQQLMSEILEFGVSPKKKAKQGHSNLFDGP